MGRGSENQVRLSALHDSQIAAGVQRVPTEDPVAPKNPKVTRNGNLDAGFSLRECIDNPIVFDVRLEVLDEQIDFAQLKASSFQAKGEIDLGECLQLLAEQCWVPL